MRFAGASLVAAAAVLVLAGPAAALDFSVNSTKDRLDANPGDNLCATGKGKCTLRAAITQANATNGDDLIKLPKGTFELTRPPDFPSTNEEGDLEINEQVTIDGRSRRKTTIEQTVKDRVLENTGGGAFNPVELTDLTVTGGRLKAPLDGGGIANEGALLVERVAIRGNSILPLRLPRGRGAKARRVIGIYGGGVYNGAGVLIVSKSLVRDNTAVTGGGGVMSDQEAFGLAISESSVTRNKAGRGTTNGGGVLAASNGRITNSTVSGNRAGSVGGGVAMLGPDGELTLDSSTVNGNAAKMGGGVHLNTTDASQILNSTISGNSAAEGGSGLYQNSTGIAGLTHTTIAANTAPADHAAVETGEPAAVDSLDFYGSIIANKGSECGGKIDAFAVDDQNIFAGNTCPSSQISTDRIANPQLKDLADNGGPTATHALKATSPAIDFVTSGGSLPTDQRGLPREPAAADAGSFERQ